MFLNNFEIIMSTLGNPVKWLNSTDYINQIWPLSGQALTAELIKIKIKTSSPNKQKTQRKQTLD